MRHKQQWRCSPGLIRALPLLRLQDRGNFCERQAVVTHPLFLGAVELDSPDDGAPLAELVDPVVEGGLGDDDHVRAMDAAVLVQVAQQRDCLQSLAQALQQGSASQHLCSWRLPWFSWRPGSVMGHDIHRARNCCRPIVWHTISLAITMGNTVEREREYQAADMCRLFMSESQAVMEHSPSHRPGCR